MSKRTPTRSIRRRLLWLILALVSLVWLIAGWRVYTVAGDEVAEVYDASLARSAGVLVGLLAHEVEEEAATLAKVHSVIVEIGTDNLAQFPALASIIAEYVQPKHEHIELLERGAHPNHRYETKLAWLARHSDGELMLKSPSAPVFDTPSDGFTDFRGDGAVWRVFSITDADTGLLVQVGERQALRSELVRYITANTLAPLLITLPILALMLWFAVGQGLKPLRRVADEVASRAPDALYPIPLDDHPDEIRPLLDGLSTLFVRLDGALEQERRFTADAAHELRTPLAALSTQAQVALRETDGARRQQALANIRKGVERATHLVEQLLELARVDACSSVGRQHGEVVLAPLLAELLADLADNAMLSGAELEFEDGGGRVLGDAGALRILARNLIDNAVRYGGKGVRVTVTTAVLPSGVELSVTDTGPGIPADRRQRALERFHRGDSIDVTGSGLGLSIVQRIADLHHAALIFEDGPGGRGIRVRVVFPSSPGSL